MHTQGRGVRTRTRTHALTPMQASKKIAATAQNRHRPTGNKGKE